MTGIKKAPAAGTVKGETIRQKIQYQDAPYLSRAAELLFSIWIKPAGRSGFQRNIWFSLEKALRSHYMDNRCTQCKKCAIQSKIIYYGT
jgi:hypothetical protein